MQQALYNTIHQDNTIAKTVTTVPTIRRTSLGRRLAQKWDLVGVLALMASGAAYGVLALAGVA